MQSGCGVDDAPVTYGRRHGEKSRSIDDCGLSGADWTSLILAIQPATRNRQPSTFDGAGAVHRRALARRQRFLVDQLFQFLARLEVRDFLRRDIDLVARLGVAALAGLALAQAGSGEGAARSLLRAL